jgi:hypothetical protein
VETVYYLCGMSGGENKKKNSDLLQYAGLATQWLVLLGVSLWIGMKLDGLISETARIFTIALPLLALIVSLWQLIRKLDKPKK